MSPRIAWIFPLGHGHAAQFANLRDSCPPEIARRSVWVGLDFFKSEDWLANQSWVPTSLQRRRNEMWHFKHRVGSEIRSGDVLFNASWNLRFVPYHLRFRSYFYADFSPSLMRSVSPWYDHFFKKSRIAQAGRELAASAIPRTARAVFTMSKWCADGIVADYDIDPARVHVVPGGANLKRWHFVDRSDHAASPVRVLMVGGEFLRKGGDRLLDWAERTATTGYELDIVTWPSQLPDRVRDVLGNPSQFQVISKDLGPWLPHVKVHCGIQPNTPEHLALYGRADVFCLPTRGDFSSIAGLEAMATGLPVIVGHVGGIPELIEEGVTGFLVKPNDDATLGTRLEQLIADRSLRLRMGRAGRASVERRFNTEHQLNQIVRQIDADTSGPRTAYSFGFLR
jgi:glycosyltransferase involved in cell wall biosynthesis